MVLIIVVVLVEMSFVIVVELTTVEFLVCFVAFVLDFADDVVLILELTSLTVVNVAVLSMNFVGEEVSVSHPLHVLSH